MVVGASQQAGVPRWRECRLIPELRTESGRQLSPGRPLEIEGSDKPALIAESLALIMRLTAVSRRSRARSISNNMLRDTAPFGSEPRVGPVGRQQLGRVEFLNYCHNHQSTGRAMARPRPSAGFGRRVAVIRSWLARPHRPHNENLTKGGSHGHG